MAWKSFDHFAFSQGLDPELFREERRSAYRVSGPLTASVHSTLFMGSASADVALLNIGVAGAAVFVPATSCSALRRGFSGDDTSVAVRLVAKADDGACIVNAQVKRVSTHARPEGVTLRFRFLETGCTRAELERRLERRLSQRDTVRVPASFKRPVAVRLSRGPRGKPVHGCLGDISHGGAAIVVPADEEGLWVAGLSTGVALAFPDQADPAQVLATVRHVRSVPLAGPPNGAAVLGMQFAERGAARCANRDGISRYIVLRQLEIRRASMRA